MKIALRCGIAALLVSCALVQAEPRLINGTPVPPGERPEVVNISTGNAGCTATVVGPRVVITAAHCGAEGAVSRFRVGGKVYQGKVTRSALYPRKDHDVAAIVTSEDIVLPAGKSYATVSLASLSVGQVLRLFGYGCRQIGGGGGSDGILREGNTKIVGFSGYDAVSREPGGAALCFGDSGGPGYVLLGGVWLLATVNSKGNIQDTNYTTRLDTAESKVFLDDLIATAKVEICGINKQCGVAAPPDPDGSFTMENAAVKIVVTSKGTLEASYIRVMVGNLMRFLADQVSPTVHPIGPPPDVESGIVHPVGPPPDVDSGIVNPIGPVKP